MVSWPATSSVISSSRSSWSDIGEPSSWRAASSIASTSSRCAVASAASLVDQLEDQLVGLVAAAHELAASAGRAEGARGGSEAGLVAELEHLV